MKKKKSVKAKKLSVSSRLKPLKALLLDCDGILTNAQTWYSGEGKWRRSYSLRDGYGIHKLLAKGFIVGIITASDSEDIRERAKQLKLSYLFEGKLDKTGHFADFLQKTGFDPSEVAYMGDDDPDIPLLKQVGFAATVPAAMESVIDVVHYKTKKEGGDGAVREVCEMILAQANFFKRS